MIGENLVIPSRDNPDNVQHVAALMADTNILTSENINLSVSDSYDFKNNPFEERMWENYKDYITTLKDDILISPEIHMDNQCYLIALKLYELSKTIIDIPLKVKIELTMLWYIYKGTNTSIEYIIRTYDKEGREKVEINYNAIIKFLEMKYNPIVWKGVYYLYIDNQYHKDNFIKIRKDIDVLLHREGISTTSKVKSIVEEIVYRTNARWQKHTDASPFNKVEDIIPVKNCVVSFKEDIHILPVSPVWGYTFSLPVKYNKDVDEKNILDFIKSISITNGLEDIEKERLLIQIVVQAIMQTTALPAYLLSGDGSNGKSTYINLVKSFAGANNCTSVSLQSLNNDKFKLACLYGKLFNLYADLPKCSINDNSIFKMVTGGDDITAEEKYGHPFNFRNKAVLLYSANELPQVDDSTFAFWRRWNLIEFNNKFEVDNEFEIKLITEDNLSALLNIVLRNIGVVKKNGLHKNNQTEVVMERWKKKSNSAYSFIVDNIKKSKTGMIKRNDLYNKYHEYCEENDITEVNRQRLYEEINKKFGVIDKPVRIDKEIVRAFEKISFTDNSDEIIITKQSTI